MGFALRAILDIIIKEKGIGMRELYCVMQASHVFYHIQEKDNRKVCLTTEVDQHRIFQSYEAWRLCIQKTINMKFHDAVNQ